jgi:diguanylate cyclase (GGDEF)-like protein
VDQRAQRSTWLFAGAIFVSGMAMAAVAATQSTQLVQPPFGASWFVLALGFGLTERYSVDIEIRREAHALTFSELILTIGLIFADPVSLVIGRVVGGVVGIAIVRRPPPVKAVFNAGLFSLEVGVALTLYYWVLGTANPVDPHGWLAAVVAVSATHLVTWACVSTVMRLAGAPVTVRSALTVLSVAGSAAIAECAVALGAAAVLWRDGRAWILLLGIGTAFGYFFISYLRIKQRHQALARLNAFTNSLEDRQSASELCDQIVLGLGELLGAQRVALCLSSAEGPIYELNDGELVHRNGPQSVLELEFEAAAPLMEPAPPALLRTKLDPRLRTWTQRIAVRLPNSTGFVLADGRLSDARGFDQEDVQLLETATGHAASAIHNAQLVNELREEATFRARQALHDDVTDLPNSRGLAETLQRPLAAGSRLAVLTIRIDSLREVNETLGRAMGDELLQQAAARLGPLTEDGWCAKTATDEFTVVVRGGNDEATATAEQIIAAFEAPVHCAGVALAITVGIGIVLAPDHGRETEILLRRASLAASRSRVEGTKVTTWAADRDPYDPQRLAIAADLRDAIPAGELQVHFQPQVDIDSGLVTGAEALVRWRHPRLGELRPDQFIAAAEYTGAIDALTEFVLSVAARTCATWREQGWDLDVSVNLSARNLANAAFADLVEGILDDTGLDPAALTLELTESSIMTEAEGAMRTLTAIHGLGVSLSIDDFGTGYSSLAHLRKLPVSEIKIDKSFVFDLMTSHSDEAIVRSMIDLGHHLGLTVVIEGVETVEVRRRLAEMGADRIQGYLLSRPMPVAAFEQWIADRPVRMAELSTSDAESSTPTRIEDHER